MTAGIFISYRRKDNIRDARAVYERLRGEFGKDAVFIDLEGLDYGEDFVLSLQRQLAHCKVLLALIGSNWVEAKDRRGRRRLDDQDDFVRIELRTALSRGIRVVPVLLDDADLPTSEELPEDLRPLLRRHALSLRFANFDADIGELVTSLRRLLAQVAAPAQAPASAALVRSAPEVAEAAVLAPLPLGAADKGLDRPAPMAAAQQGVPNSPPPNPARLQSPLPADSLVPGPPPGPAGPAGAGLPQAARRAWLAGGGGALLAGMLWLARKEPSARPAPVADAPSPPSPTAPAVGALPWASQEGYDQFGRYADLTAAGVVQRMRWIEPGEFLMGSPESEPERRADEGPQHAVRISRGFWLADSACTQVLWQAVMNHNPSSFKGEPNLPVERVSFDDVEAFLGRLRQAVQGAQGLALPTEAQWEHACRAGTRTAFNLGQQVTPDQVNYDGNRPYNGGLKGLYRERTVPVKSLPPNAWGLFEMHGNVWEWCRDGPRSYLSLSTAVVDPEGPGGAGLRVLRGGSWNVPAAVARSAYRGRDHQGNTWRYGGFRLALRT